MYKKYIVSVITVYERAEVLTYVTLHSVIKEAK